MLIAYYEKSGEGSMHGRRKNAYRIWRETLKEGDRLKELGIYGKIITWALHK